MLCLYNKRNYLNWYWNNWDTAC